MDTRNFMFMFYGFAAVWIILVAYVASMVARERRIQRQMEGLRRMIEDREHERERR